MGERISNVFGFLLSLTFFSVLLAVMLVAVSILPDTPVLPPPTLPSETGGAAVRTPQPVDLGELALLEAPEVAPLGAATPSVGLAPEVVAPPTGPGGGPTEGDGTIGPGRGPTGGGGLEPRGPDRNEPGKGRGLAKGKDTHPRRGPGGATCEDDQHGRGRGKGHLKMRGNGHCAPNGARSSSRGSEASSGGPGGGGGEAFVPSDRDRRHGSSDHPGRDHGRGKGRGRA